APGDTFITAYNTAGTFNAVAKIDGTQMGTLAVTVVSVDIHGPIACQVDYQREKSAIVSPVNAIGAVTFQPNNPQLLTVSIKEETQDGATLYLKALQRGRPAIRARLGGNDGPMLTTTAVDEFSLDTPARIGTVVNRATGKGGTTVTIRPYLPGLRFDFSLFAHQTKFLVGGEEVTSYSANTSTDFAQAYDPATGEMIGQVQCELIAPPAEAAYCMNISVMQQDLLWECTGAAMGLNGALWPVDIEFITTSGDQSVELPTPFENCVSLPVISASASQAHLQDGVVTFNVAGTVTDATSDIVADPGKKVQTINVLTDSGAICTLSLSNVASPEMPWKPYKFLANYQTSVSLEVEGPGTYPVTLETSPNVAGNTGHAQVAVRIEGDQVYSTCFNLVVQGNFDSDKPDQIAFFKGDRASATTDPVLTETGNDSLVFEGSTDLGLLTAVIEDVSGLTEAIDTMLVRFLLVSPDGAVSNLEATLVETGAQTGVFRCDNVRVLKGTNRAVIGRHELSNELNLAFDNLSSEEANTLTFYFGRGATAYESASLAETGVNTRVFSGALNGANLEVSFDAFTGWTDSVDTSQVTMTFTYPDGMVCRRGLFLAETGPNTKRLRSNEFPLSLGSIDDDPGGDAGTFLPVLIRISGPDLVLANPTNTVQMFGAYFKTARLQVEGQPSYYPVDDSGNAVIFAPSANAQSAVNVQALTDIVMKAVLCAGPAGTTTAEAPKESGLFVGGAKQNDTAEKIMKDHNWDPDKLKVGKETIDRMVKDITFAYKYDSWEVLGMELKLRQAIVDAAKLLGSKKIAFASLQTQKANAKYWEVFPGSALWVLDRKEKKVPDPAGGGGWLYDNWQEGLETATNDIFEQPDKYSFECALAIGLVWIKAQVDIVKAAGKDVDSVFCKSWTDKDGNQDSNQVAIAGLAYWTADPKKLAYNKNSRQVDVMRKELLPGDWFASVPGLPQNAKQNFIYVGEDKFYGHAVSSNFPELGATDDVGPMKAIRDRGGPDNRRQFLDPVHYLKITKD
ncbi:MAG: hypothetical protein JXA57_13680, partial [Armatimonadetes bacterium]|nr:hypothetical protein [Armatimonadota bacterium]